MPHSFLVTVDIGTSSTKSTLWHYDGTVITESVCPYSIDRPMSTWAQIHPELWWKAACSTIKELISRSRISAEEVAGIAIDGQGWAMVSIDSSGKVIFPALIWQDRRAEEEANWLRAIPNADGLVNISANPIDAAYITPKIIWLRNNYPQVFSAVDTFLTTSGFIVYKLTGIKTCDYTQAYGYHFYDVCKKSWDENAAKSINFPLEKMPRLYSPLEIVGEITIDAARAIDLPAGIPVIAGGLDASVGALGAGAIKNGQTVDQGGQAGGMLLSVDKVIVEPRLIFGNHILPGLYLLQSGTVGGASLGWLKSILNLDNDFELKGKNHFEWLSKEAEKSPPGSNGLIFLPYMAGERTPLWNSNLRGAFFGLTYKTDRADLSRSIMEGCAFAVYHNLQIAIERGVSVYEWLGNGGAADSDIWCQIKSDITNRPFIVRTRKDGKQGGHTLGLFAMLTNALGFYSSIENTINALLPNSRRFEPNTNNHQLYEDYFSSYLSLSKYSVDEFSKLSGLGKKTIKIGEHNL